MIKKRLVLENCEHSFNIKDCLEISENTGVLLYLIHIISIAINSYIQMRNLNQLLYIFLKFDTWTKRSIKPKFHVSEQGAGKTGHHSDYIDVIPDYLLEIPEKYGIHIDIMIEAKMKELAIQKLYEKYPFLNCLVKE